MVSIPDHVQPGDLITADQINRILQAISSLDNRVTTLESSAISGSAVVITDLIPPSGVVKVGDPLTVIGRNFGFSIGAQRVYIDDLRVDAFNQGSNDTHLVFNIPLSITNVPQQGRSAVLTVSNATSSAQRMLMLQPALTLTGAVDVIWQGVTPASIVAGQPLTFSFMLRSRANLDAAYAVNPLVPGLPDFQNNLQVLDSNLTPISSRQLQVPAGQSTPFSIRIGPVPPGTNNTQFALVVNAGASNVTGSSGAIVQTVGQPADLPDTTISLNFSSSQVQRATAGSVSATDIQLATGGAAKLSLNATFSMAASYLITASLIAGATNWQMGPLASTTPSPYLIAQADLANPQGIAAKTLDFTVVRQDGARNGMVVFQVQRQGATQTRKFVMNIAAT
jgi:hypothetical protein